MTHIAAVCCVGLTLGCSAPGQDLLASEGGGSRSCPSLGGPVQTGTLQAPRLDEASGMVASRRHSGVLWSHNDGGDAELFALDESGRWIASLMVADAAASDWEDIARVQTADGDILVLADIGDNEAVRASVALVAVPEPDVLPEQVVEADVTARIDVTYPDGPADAEAFVVDPRWGDGYIFTKSSQDGVPAMVLRIPGPLVAGPVTAESVGVLDGLGAVTAADVASDGSALLVRSDEKALWWSLEGGIPVEEALATPGCEVPLARETAGESVALTIDGAGYHSTSEGVGAAIHRVLLD